MSSTIEIRQQLRQVLARDINCLSDPDRFKRKAAIEKISSSLFQNPTVNYEASVDFLLDDLRIPLLQLLVDPIEMVRECTLTMIMELLEKSDNRYSEILQFLVPPLVQRVGKYPFMETSEELREIIAHLLQKVFSSTSSKGAIKIEFSPLMEVIKSLMQDSNPEVKISSASLLQNLCTFCPEKVQMSTSSLANACIQNLTHQRQTVRQSSLCALTAVILCGGESLPLLLRDQLLPTLMNILSDRTYSVRRQLAFSIGDLLTKLPFPFVDMFEHRFLYMLLSLVYDEAEEVGIAALETLNHACALRKKAILSKLAESPSASTISDDITDDMKAAAEAVRGTEEAAREINSHAESMGYQIPFPQTSSRPLPVELSSSSSIEEKSDIYLHPMHARPSVDSIFVVQRLMGAILSLVLPDLEEWTSRLRICAARAFLALLSFAETQAAGSAPLLVQALCNGARDEDEEVRRLLGAAARVFGRFVPPTVQLGTLLPRISGEISGYGGADQLAAAVAVLSAAISSLSHAQCLDHLRSIVSAVCSGNVLDAISTTSGSSGSGGGADASLALRRQLASLTVVLAERAFCSGTPSQEFIHECQHSNKERYLFLVNSSSSTASSSIGSGGLVNKPVGIHSYVNLEALDDFLILSLNLLYFAAPRIIFHFTPTASSTSSATDANQSLSMALGSTGDPLEDDVYVMVMDALKATARTLRMPSLNHLMAARVSPIIFTRLLFAKRAISQKSSSSSASNKKLVDWTTFPTDRRFFDALLRCFRPALASSSLLEAKKCMNIVVQAICSSAGLSQEPEVRAAALSLLEVFLAGADPDAVASSTLTSTAGTGSSHALSLLSPPGSPTQLPHMVDNFFVDNELRLTYDFAALFPSSSSSPEDSGPDPVLQSVLATAKQSGINNLSFYIFVHGIVPNLIWKAGNVSSALRKAAAACLMTMCDRRLLSVEVTRGILAIPETPGVLRATLSDDETATRLMAASTLRQLAVGALEGKGRVLYLVTRPDDGAPPDFNDSVVLGNLAKSIDSGSLPVLDFSLYSAVLGEFAKAPVFPGPIVLITSTKHSDSADYYQKVGYKFVRDFYPDLLKRLDDANDGVRARACAALFALGQNALLSDLRGVPAETILETLLPHLDDASDSVRLSVAVALLPFAAVESGKALALLETALTRHRRPALCEALLRIVRLSQKVQKYSSAASEEENSVEESGVAPAAAGVIIDVTHVTRNVNAHMGDNIMDDLL